MLQVFINQEKNFDTEVGILLTGELKNKIDNLWDIIWAGGSESSALPAIEQITYLMFIRDLDDSDTQKAASANILGIPYNSIFDGEFEYNGKKWPKNQFRWSVFRDLPPDVMFNTISEGVFPFIKQLHGDRDSAYTKYIQDAKFTLPNPIIVSKIITNLDEIYEIIKRTDEKDVKGDLYEHILSSMATNKNNGQFRTPRHIIDMMVALAKPTPEDDICDPACGSAGFLVAASDYLKKNHRDEIMYNQEVLHHYDTDMFTGFDKDPVMLRISAMNMMVHGVSDPNIVQMDSLGERNDITGKYSLILANPPFTGAVPDKLLVSPNLLKVTDTKKSELLFLSLMLRMLKVGGRCVVIVPDGVLFGKSKPHKAIKKEIIDNNRLEAVISMPSGVFKKYSGVSTAVLVFTKTGTGGTDNVWFYDMKADGYSLDDKRVPVDECDIPDIIERFDNRFESEMSRTREEQSFVVPVEEIIEKEYDLSINKYKKIVYEEIKYPPTIEIIESMETLSRKLTEELAILKQMILE